MVVIVLLLFRLMLLLLFIVALVVVMFLKVMVVGGVGGGTSSSGCGFGVFSFESNLLFLLLPVFVLQLRMFLMTMMIFYYNLWTFLTDFSLVFVLVFFPLSCFLSKKRKKI